MLTAARSEVHVRISGRPVLIAFEAGFEDTGGMPSGDHLQHDGDAQLESPPWAPKPLSLQSPNTCSNTTQDD